MYQQLLSNPKINSLVGDLSKPLNFSLLAVAVTIIALIYSKSSFSDPNSPMFDEAAHPDSLVVSTYNLSQLSEFDGSGPTKIILIGICGKVYDVTSKPQFYGPQGPYGVFAGRDATMALAKNSLTSEFIPKSGDKIYDLSQLSDKEKEALDGWVSFFDNKYEVVGSVVF
ncbi:hypothetical protein BB559_000996 [Furculomyces boomerangus]|uniref:Cytochrome b5 heme-binding domain-containing protein n=2 Tax=Harpellales TaxID=61421 RepID=A0A2T9YE90_9FUNG|nr:hypothetical protein BB559_004503 [Furculomyces boomerangus]PVU99134.1 hypothetical protein BB559_000996 [Furculomyces boomerangus]PWA02935.1 hypothetical protein BB558_000899 [Smittium angustum]